MSKLEKVVFWLRRCSCLSEKGTCCSWIWGSMALVKTSQALLLRFWAREPSVMAARSLTGFTDVMVAMSTFVVAGWLFTSFSLTCGVERHA